jgi:hypothetical protein
MNGSKPSAMSISATALSAMSQNSSPAKRYFFDGGGVFDSSVFDGGAAGDNPGPRIDLKKSLPGSRIIRSDLLRKLARYASRLR